MGRVNEVNGAPVGVVGRIVAGENAGFFIEVDDDTRRPGGSGGWYVLVWNEEVGYDEWYETADDLPGALEGRRIEWMTSEESALVPGRHRHDEA